MTVSGLPSTIAGTELQPSRLLGRPDRASLERTCRKDGDFPKSDGPPGSSAGDASGQWRVTQALDPRRATPCQRHVALNSVAWTFASHRHTSDQRPARSTESTWKKLGLASDRGTDGCDVKGSRGAGEWGDGLVIFRFAEYTVNSEKFEIMRSGRHLSSESQVLDLLIALPQSRNLIVT